METLRRLIRQNMIRCLNILLSVTDAIRFRAERPCSTLQIHAIHLRSFMKDLMPQRDIYARPATCLMLTEQYSIGRWIIWKPIIVEVYENRIKPHETKKYIFNYNNSAGDEIRVQVVYHIMTERAKNKLKQKYGLKEDISIEYKIFEDVTPLNP